MTFPTELQDLFDQADEAASASRDASRQFFEAQTDAKEADKVLGAAKQAANQAKQAANEKREAAVTALRRWWESGEQPPVKPPTPPAPAPKPAQ